MVRSLSAALAPALVPAVLASAVLAALPAAADPVTDARGVTVEVGDRSRVVSIGGTVTEILYDLGVDEAVVAVDSTSLFPPEALKENDNVGYMRALSAEGVLSMTPSLVLAIEGSGPPEVVELLGASSVPLVVVDDDPTPEAVTARIRFLAGLMGVPERGEALAGDVEARFATLAEAKKAITKPTRVLFVITVRDGHPMVAGSNTAADAMIRLAGGVNVAAGFDGYKPMGDEAIVEAQPEFVLVMGSGAHAVDTEALLDTPAFRTTPAGIERRLQVIDGLSLLGFGPRSPDVALTLARTLHPGQVP